MLAYKDFGLPKPTTVGTFLKLTVPTLQPTEEGVREANAWMEAQGKQIQLLSVETVQPTGGGAFLRVWYQHGGTVNENGR